jgi:hypothetical protein
MTMRKCHVATVRILVEAPDSALAADAISAALTENGIYEPDSLIIDWSYLKDSKGCYVPPMPVDIVPDYDRDEADLDKIAKALL